MLQKIGIHSALFLVALIYAATFTIAKEVMPAYIHPFGLIVIRVWGATLLLWTTHALVSTDKITVKADFKLLMYCSVVGIAANMLLFFKGLSQTTPINGAVIMVMTPLFVSVFAYFILQERFNWKRVLGLVIGLVGAIFLLLQSIGVQSMTAFSGDIMIMLNAIIYAYYLIIAKPLLHKYKPLTVIKWTFLFGAILVLPFGLNDLLQVDWAHIPLRIYLCILFLIVGATYLTYLLNAWALRYVNPSVVGAYIYLQPVLASIIAIMLGKDVLTLPKALCAIVIFIGVYLVSFSEKIALRTLFKKQQEEQI